MADAEHVEGAYPFENLVGIPSHHYDPAFARFACSAIAAFSPSVVALELPPEVEDELEWAASCWPAPVVCASRRWLHPFVPGDSIFEAYRTARSRGIATLLIDLPMLERPGGREDFPIATSLPSPEFASRAGTLFLDATDAVINAAGPPRPRDIAREEHMAAALSALMEANSRVLWVGGMAHWTRLLARLSEKIRTSRRPPTDATDTPAFTRMRLAPSALFRMTGRLPWLVARYGESPDDYDEVQAMQRLALEATATKESPEDVVILLSGAGASSPDEDEGPASIAPIDVARTLQYARNLALTTDMRERPELGELLMAACATIGPRYAGRLYQTAMADAPSEAMRRHDALEWDIAEGHEQFRCGNKRLAARPYRPVRVAPIIAIEVRRRARSEPYKDLPESGGQKKSWNCYAEDEDSYVAFVNYILRRASQASSEDGPSAPFSSGLRDGVDLRATARNWTRDTIYVREERRGHMNFTNGAIDWTSTSERSDLLSGARRYGGWTDPSLTQLGSCSRECDRADGTPSSELLVQEPRILRAYRDFSLVTLDVPNLTRSSKDGMETPSFYDRVILPLVHLQETKEDNLYGWLDLMFRFCAGKPFAYYSQYVPSTRIYNAASRYQVELRHFPLRLLSRKLIDRNRSFRFMYLTREQWEELRRRRSEACGTWSHALQEPG